MSQTTVVPRLDTLLYWLRPLFAAASLLFILYCSIYLWLYLPYEDFMIAWRPDSRLVVIDVPDGSIVTGLLQPGDHILTIGSQPLRRMRPTYPLPLQPTYEYTLRRGEDIVVSTIVFSRQVTPLTVRLRLPPTILALTGWFVGSLILFFARRDNPQAIHAGYIFLLGSVILIGVQAALNGVPGAWVGGHVLLFLLAPSWLYLGLIPRTAPLGHRTQFIVRLLFVLSIFLSLAAVFEVLILFPQPSSFQEVTGISLYALGFLLNGLGLLACVAALAYRAWTMPRTSYLRQQIVILLLFIGTGTLPVVLLTILPRVLFDVTPLPFPIAISLMLLIPAGYLFVIYRKGFLGLDLFFSRTIYLVLLLLSVFGFYVGGLYLVQRLLNLGGAEAIAPATVVFFPTLLLTIYVNQPVHQFVDRLVYGKVALNQDTLASFLQAVSTRPELLTLETIARSLAKMLDISQAALLLKGEEGYWKMVMTLGVEASNLSLNELSEFNRPLLRVLQDGEGDDSLLFAPFAWAEMLIPVLVRDEQVGLLVLSRPGPDGFFNARQVAFLDQAARVLAMGAENISLFEAARKMAWQMQVVREQERKHLSMKLHDDPLHQVTYAKTILDMTLAKYFPGVETQEQANGNHLASQLVEATEHLHCSATSLRNICHELHLPFQHQGIKVAVEEMINYFTDTYSLNVAFSFTMPEEMATRVPEKVMKATRGVLSGALLNVVKHAEGAPVWVALEYDKRMLVLSVTDNGPGVQVIDLSYTELMRRGHLGLIGMHEWAQHAGGELDVLPNEPSGTKVLLRCPL
jgi:signal transduction histidine kinase